MWISIKKPTVYTVGYTVPLSISLFLKGQCHEIFRFWFFSSTSLPPASEYPIRTVSKFFENSRRYSQLKVDKFAAGIVDTGGKFATGINNTSETGGLGETDAWKKPKAKNLVTLSL